MGRAERVRALQDWQQNLQGEKWMYNKGSFLLQYEPLPNQDSFWEANTLDGKI